MTGDGDAGKTPSTRQSLMPTGKGFTLGDLSEFASSPSRRYECHTRCVCKERHDGRGDARQTPKKSCLPKLKITVMTNDTIPLSHRWRTRFERCPIPAWSWACSLAPGCNSAVPMKLADLHESKIRHIRQKDPDAVDSVVSTE